MGIHAREMLQLCVKHDIALACLSCTGRYCYDKYDGDHGYTLEIRKFENIVTPWAD